MKTAIIINHPNSDGSENKKIEHALGDEGVHITHMKLTGFTVDRIRHLSKSCDTLLFFHTTLEKILHLIDTSDPVFNNIRKVSPSKNIGNYAIATL